MSKTYAIGDIHGQFYKLKNLLQSTKLIDNNLRWSGGESTLCFMGDYTDRGSDGIGTIDLIMRLQNEAPDFGGKVVAIIGNHDPMFISAYQFPREMTSEGITFMMAWMRNGGNMNDYERLTPKHIEWIKNLPAMVHLNHCLVIHADSTMYANYGATIHDVNQTLNALLHDDDLEAWDLLLDQFTDREAFSNRRPEGIENARQFLQKFGGKQIVHGHTPISKMTGQYPEDVHKPLFYADGLCVNIDGGMYRGSPGFIYRLPDL